MAKIGDTLTITWTSQDWLDPDGAPLTVKIELSRNGGLSYTEVLSAGTTDDGSFGWVVTSPAASSCKIKFSDPADASVYFESGAFAIESSTRARTIGIGIGIGIGE